VSDLGFGLGKTRLTHSDRGWWPTAPSSISNARPFAVPRKIAGARSGNAA
jgi:hypothetical protein